MPNKHLALPNRTLLAEEAARHDLAAAGDIVLRVAQDGTLLEAHVPRGDLLSCPSPPLNGRPIDEAMPDVATLVRKAVKEVLRFREPVFFSYHSPSRAAFDVRAALTLNDHVLFVFQDVTRRRRLEVPADGDTHDSLTALPGRLLFEQHLRKALDSGMPLAVFLIELPEMPSWLREHGETVVDQIVLGVTGSLRQTTRCTDIPARLGRNRFGVLIRGIDDVEQAHVIGRRTLEHFSGETRVADRHVKVSARLGIATSRGTRDVARLQSYAERALSLAGDSSKDDVQVYACDPAAKSPTVQDTNESRKQIPFQPIFEFSSGAVVGFNVDGGAADEEADLAGDWQHAGVLVAACEELTRLGAGYPDRRWYATFGLPAKQLRDPEFAASFRATVKASGADPAWFWFEVAEHLIVHDLDWAHQAFGELRDFGCRVVLKDFGIGYSSLACLEAFRVDGLKINGSLVETMVDRCDLVPSIVEFGQAQGLKIFATGVAEQRQADLLRKCGCHFARGSMYTPNLSREELRIYFSSLGGQAVANSTNPLATSMLPPELPWDAPETPCP